MIFSVNRSRLYYKPSTMVEGLCYNLKSFDYGLNFLEGV